MQAGAGQDGAQQGVPRAGLEAGLVGQQGGGPDDLVVEERRVQALAVLLGGLDEGAVVGGGPVQGEPGPAGARGLGGRGCAGGEPQPEGDGG